MELKPLSMIQKNGFDCKIIGKFRPAKIKTISVIRTKQLAGITVSNT